MTDDTEKYLPNTRAQRRGIGVCLSGGGYRATLFHAGALRRLAELGVLSHPDLRTISSVSGGSIAAAFLAMGFSWPLSAAPSKQEWNTKFYEPLRSLTRKNIRTSALLKGLFSKASSVGVLANRYNEALGGPEPLSVLPDQFVLCATDLAFGVNWELTGKSVGDYQAGYITAPSNWSLGLAVAASSCFPPIFQPLKLPSGLQGWQGGKAEHMSPATWAAAMKGLRLTDGGDYDNMGTEPVWKDHATVLVSDAGGVFDFEADKNLFWRVQRYQAIQEQQTRALRKRWLIANFKQGSMDGAYWSTRSARSRYDSHDTQGYSKSLADEVIGRIRTDLDAFSDVEAAVLENHGYLLADIAVQKHCPSAATVPRAPLDVPHPEWSPGPEVERHIRSVLRDSHKRKTLGRS